MNFKNITAALMLFAALGLGACGGGGGSSDTTPAATLVSVAVTPANPSMAKGVTQQFTAWGTYSDGTTKDIGSKVTWSSSDGGVATIDEAGLATGAGTGSVDITATETATGKSAAAKLTVTAAVLQTITVTPADSSIPKGLTKQFIATGNYTDGTSQDITNVVAWTTSNSALASIDNTGLATGMGTGSPTITATDNASGIFGSTSLTVTAAELQSITLTTPILSLPKGLTIQFTATGKYSDGTTQQLTTGITWSSSNTAVATVSSSGVVTGADMGSATIKATDNVSGKLGSLNINVTAAELQSITLSPANPTLAKGLTTQFTATGEYSDGTTQDLTTGITWSSSNTAAATVSPTGSATGFDIGSATIKATHTATSVFGSTTLSVTAAALVSIVVTPSNPTFGVDQTKQFTATGHYSDGSTATLSADLTWSSSDTATATVDPSGLATGAAAGGPITITATDNATGKAGSTTATLITCTAPTPPAGVSPTSIVSAAAGSDTGVFENCIPYKTITAALAAAVSGDVVWVAPGTYDVANGETFPLTIPAGVALIGDEANKGNGTAKTLIVGSDSTGVGVVKFIAPQSNSTFAGFLGNVGSTLGTTTHLYFVMLQTSNVAIRSNTLESSYSGVASDGGITSWGGINDTITGNIIKGFYGGISFSFSGGPGTKIENNVITANDIGVNYESAGADLGGGSAGSVGGNTISCNTTNDLRAFADLVIDAQNNFWDHNSPSFGFGQDIYNNGGSAANFITTGAGVAANPCL